MYLTLTNTGDEPEIAAGLTSGGISLSGISRGGTAWTEVLDPGEPLDTANEVQIVVIGDKPSVRTQVEQGLATATEAVKELADAIRDRRRPAISGEGPPPVSVNIANHGGNAIRVILGDGVNDTTIPPGKSASCTAPGYLELRELGSAPQQGGTPD
jgi:hypothetical protein